MNYLHLPTDDEARLATGAYRYLRSGAAAGEEAWELSRSHDGAFIWRSEVTETAGQLLSHLLLSPERRPDRLQLRWRPATGPLVQAVYTFFDDHVMVTVGGKRDTLDLPPHTTLAAPDVGSRALMLPHLDWAQMAPELGMVFTVQRRGGTFWSRPVKWTFRPLGRIEQPVGGVARPARGVTLSVPGLPEAEGWFDEQGIPLRWAEGDFVAEAVRYQPW